MPTLDQAARQLGISEKTLRRWIALLNDENPKQPIETPRHKRDGRFRVIAEQDLQRVIDARAEMPGSASLAPAPNMPPAFTRAKSDGLDSHPASLPIPVPQKPRQQPVRATHIEGSLPDGLVSLTEAADAHGVLRYMTTFRRWRDEGKLEYDPRAFEGELGQFGTSKPLTQRGLAQFVRLASRKEGFRRCASCPHADGGASADAAPAE